MAKRDYYEVLGVTKQSTPDEVKKAYRRLAIKYHPDKTSGDKQAEEKFKEASEAYEVLSDKDKKSKYDRFGHAGLDGAFGHSGGFRTSDFTHAADFSDIFGESGFSSIFDTFFGGGATRSQQSRVKRGEDLRAKVTLSLEEIAIGVDKKIKINVKDDCSVCNGTGSKNGNVKTCSQCGGTGSVRQIQQSFFGQAQVVVTCPTCRGEGEIIDSPCSACNGSGRKTVRKTINVHIPAGVEEGQYINLSGQGNSSVGKGVKGNLLVMIAESDNSVFTRDGKNLLIEFPISFSQATLGSEIVVPTIYKKKIKMKIGSGTQSGKIYRVKGQGISGVNSSYKGDMFVRIRVVTPTSISSTEKELFEKLSQFDSNLKLKPEKSFFDKIKNIFS